MVKFEIKKVFLRRGNQIAVALLVVLLCVVCFFAGNISYVNEEGETEKGFGAVKKLREEQKEWAGFLDEETIQKVIAENNKISQTPEAQSDDFQENDKAFHKKQGFLEIRNLLNYAYAEDFRDYNYFRADSLKPEDASEFYENRISLLENWLSGEGKELFSETEKEYLIKKYENLQTPFFYDYVEGWKQLFLYFPTILMILMLVLGYLVSGIFAREFQWKADSILFSSLYGKNKAVSAKVKACFYIVTGIYWCTVLLYTGAVLLYLGADGAFCPIQANSSDWKSFYEMTNMEKYVLCAVGGYLGCLFISFLTMLVSGKTKSSAAAVILPFVLVFLPSFLSNINNRAVTEILGLLPDRLLQLAQGTANFTLYEIGGKVLDGIFLLFLVYSAFCALLLPVLKRMYRK
ncbi:MAG: ABC transporter permease [Blautia sp.]